MNTRPKTRSVSVCLSIALTAVVIAGCASEPSDITYRRRGDEAFSQGRFEDARIPYIKYNQIRPGRAEIYYKLGLCDARTGRPAEAVQNLRIASDLDPENVQYVEAFAQALFDVSEHEGVYELLRWRTEQPGLSDDYIRLGRFAAMMGDADEAELAFKTAAKIDQGLTVAPQLALADFYQSIGDAEQELLRLKMALFIDTNHEEVNGRIRALGFIPGPTFHITPAEFNR